VQHDLPFLGLDHTFFPARGGCRMRLYKDAHVDHVPEIPLAGNRLYQPPCYWIDLYNAICAARHFIYVTGASICADCRSSRADKIARSHPWQSCACRQSLLVGRAYPPQQQPRPVRQHLVGQWLRIPMPQLPLFVEVQSGLRLCQARHQLHSVLGLW